MRRHAAIALLATALLAGGCGDDEPGTTSTTAADEEPQGSTDPQTPGPKGEEFEAAQINLLTGSDNGVAPDTREGTAPKAPSGADLEVAADAAGCELRLDLPDEGSTHLKPGDRPPAYKTDPPTSGDHILPPLQQADGAYSEYPAPVATVHSLEHGRVNVQYSPHLAEADQLLLKGLFEEEPGGMLLFPNRFMPYEVAATAWRQLLGCKSWDGDATIEAIRAFRDEFRGNGPEDVPVDF